MKHAHLGLPRGSTATLTTSAFGAGDISASAQKSTGGHQLAKQAATGLS